MLYTSRRTTAPGAGVAWVHGTDIGVASLMEDGVGWLYRGTLDLEYEFGRNTFWAPEVVWDGGCYHMYVSYIRGVPQTWAGHERHILHYTSADMVQWTAHGKVCLSSDYVIDACVFERPDGGYRMWYKDEADGHRPGWSRVRTCPAGTELVVPSQPRAATRAQMCSGFAGRIGWSWTRGRAGGV